MDQWRRRTQGFGIFLGVLGTVMMAGAGNASGPSMDGLQGVVRVHAAQTGPRGLVNGTIFGTYAREQYSAENSVRGQGEVVKFAGSTLSLAYAPTPFVELALQGALEDQIVIPGVGDQTSEAGLRGIAFGLKSILTPADRNVWKLAAEVNLATATGNENALVGSWNPDGLDLGGRLALTYTQPRESKTPPVRAHVNAGFLSRTGEFDETAWATTSQGATPSHLVLHGDQFIYGAAVEVPMPRRTTFFAEWSGEYDVNANAPLSDNPMRVTPGLRWTGKGGTFSALAGWELSVASEESGPGGQLVAGISLGGYVAPARGQVIGVVRDANTGEPIPGAKVLARNEGSRAATTDVSGNFTAEIEEGYAVLDLSAEGYVGKTRVVEIQGQDELVLDLVLSKENIFGSVEGFVQDGENGTPVAARVRVVGEETWSDCDVEGSFALHGVPSGEVDLEFEARGYLSRIIPLQVAQGNTVPVRASLDRDEHFTLGVFSGSVRDAATGEPLGATVVLGEPAGKTIQAEEGTGTFDLELEAGTYEVTFSRAGYLAKTETIHVLEKRTQEREVVLTPLPSSLALQGAVFDAGSATIKRESLASLDEAGKFLLENPDVRVVIRGNGDAEGGETPEELAQRRADAVLKYLVVSYGIDPLRLRAVPGSGNNANPTVELRVDEDWAAE